MRLVMIDNYDSFTYNLVQLFYEFDLEVLVFRHDEIGLEEIAALKPDWLCISPGPKAPDQAGISKAAIAHFYRSIPILGVCLGHQALNEVFGGATVKAPIPVHGKRHQVFHRGQGVFKGLPSPFPAARYHSLMAHPTSPDLEVTAWTEDGVIMGLKHRHFPLHGVQFHPESFLTSHGHTLAANFLGESDSWGRGPGAKAPATLSQPLIGGREGGFFLVPKLQLGNANFRRSSASPPYRLFTR